MISKTDSEIIRLAQRGFRLPYSKYSSELLDSILRHKKNNIAAIVICADGITEYVDGDTFALQAEALSELYEEIAQFCLFGLLGIGYFGISVENGIPRRVDSTGANIGPLYESVYETITPAEYALMGRIDSMLLDQKDNRRFKKYIRMLKSKLATTFISQLEQSDSSHDTRVERCLSSDELFCRILIKIGWHTNGAGSFTETYVINNVPKISQEINKIIVPYRSLLEDDKVTNLAGYTMTDLKPVVPRHVF